MVKNAAHANPLMKMACSIACRMNASLSVRFSNPEFSICGFDPIPPSDDGAVVPALDDGTLQNIERPLMNEPDTIPGLKPDRRGGFIPSG